MVYSRVASSHFPSASGRVRHMGRPSSIPSKTFYTNSSTFPWHGGLAGEVSVPAPPPRLPGAQGMLGLPQWPRAGSAGGHGPCAVSPGPGGGLLSSPRSSAPSPVAAKLSLT